MRLPGTDVDVFPLSFGTADLGSRGDDAFQLLDTYAEAGGNFIDSAHCYAFWAGQEGRPERTIGEWLRKTGVRDRIVLSTKGGHPPLKGYPHAKDFLSPAAVQGDLEESHERLGVDVIDLYYLHRDDGITPVAEIVDMLNALPGVRYLGASNWSVARVLEANAYAAQSGQRGFIALQNQWSLAIPTWEVTADPTIRFVTREDFEACTDAGLTLHPYSSTANGYFAGRTENAFGTETNQILRQKTVELANRLNKTPTQIALAWLLSQPGSVVPIVGTTSADHLKEALGAVDLDLDDLSRSALTP